MIAVAVLYLVAVCTLGAIAWREAGEANRREDELERRRNDWPPAPRRRS